MFKFGKSKDSTKAESPKYNTMNKQALEKILEQQNEKIAKAQAELQTKSVDENFQKDIQAKENELKKLKESFNSREEDIKKTKKEILNAKIIKRDALTEIINKQSKQLSEPGFLSKMKLGSKTASTVSTVSPAVSVIPS